MMTKKYFEEPILIFIKRKDSLIYLVIVVAGLSLLGWFLGKTGLTTYGTDYFPIAPSAAFIFIALGMYFIASHRRKTIVRTTISIPFLSTMIFLCMYLFLNYFFKFAWDIERIYFSDSAGFQNLSAGRISPIAALLFVFIGLGLLGHINIKSRILTYVGCYSSLLALLESSLIIIGYIYDAPLLYGSTIRPVAFPAGLNFVLFSLTLLRYYDSSIWTFNIRRINNSITRQLVKTFLPIAMAAVILDGFLQVRIEYTDLHPAFKTVILLFVVAGITIYFILRFSAGIGNELLARENRLKEDEIKFRTVADYTFDWEFWLNNDNQFIYCSPSCKRITGYDRKIFIENPDLMTQIIHPEDLASYNTHIDSTDPKKPCSGMYYRIITRSDEVRWIEHICQPVFDENGAIIGRRGSGKDVTIRISALNQINELNEKLQLLNSDKDRFISILGHDLKTPLNNLLGLTEVLKKDLPQLTSEELLKIVDYIHQSAVLSNNLLKDILTWARSQQGKIPFNPQFVHLVQLCKNVMDVLNPSAFAKNITINLSVDEKLHVYADSNMVKSILLNLVSNAMKFTNSGGRITVSAEEFDEIVIISVSDTGIGISPGNIAKLFDISQVVSTKGTANETGTGLGLLLCKDFVEKQGGKIWVESEVKKGSHFKFTLPKSSERTV